MAPVSALDPTQLSSNWKKLQAQIPKRRRGHGEPRVGKPVRPEMTLTTNENGAASLAQWAAENDISKKDMQAAYGTDIPHMADFVLDQEHINEGLSSHVKVGRYVAVDCEMVGVGPHPERESALARVSIVNYHGEQVYDSFVLPKEAVTDFRTHVSGITPALLRSARTLEAVQEEVVPLLTDKVLIGHALRNDLDALLLGHPQRDIRDTSKHAKFRALANGRSPSLKRLALEFLKANIQGAEHSSVEDARATMFLFRLEKDEFEKDNMSRFGSAWRTAQVKKAGASKRKKKKR